MNGKRFFPIALMAIMTLSIFIFIGAPAAAENVSKMMDDVLGNETQDVGTDTYPKTWYVNDNSGGRIQNLSMYLIEDSNPKIDPLLAYEMKKKPGEEIPVIIVLKEQLKVPPRARFDIQKAKSLAAKSQKSLMIQLESVGAKDLKQFWIINAISAKIPAEKIETIAKHSDVEKIWLDRKIRLMDDAAHKADESGYEDKKNIYYNLNISPEENDRTSKEHNQTNQIRNETTVDKVNPIKSTNETGEWENITIHAFTWHNARAKTIIVPDDYPTIQQAVNNAASGNTIIVRDGTYTENVDMNKSLTIVAENGSATTIVQAVNSSDYVFEVTADYVNIFGFTVTGTDKAGIHLYNANHCNISDNHASNNCKGFYLESSNSCMLMNNAAIGNRCDGDEGSNGYCYGFHLQNSSNNTLTNNTANQNRAYGGDGGSGDDGGDGYCYGFHFQNSSNNTLTNNIANSNSGRGGWGGRGGDGGDGYCYGIYFQNSSNNTLTNNIANSNSGEGCRGYSYTGPYYYYGGDGGDGYCYGIYLKESNSNMLMNINASSNRGYGGDGGVGAYGGDGGRGYSYGIYMMHSNNSMLINTNASSNCGNGGEGGDGKGEGKGGNGGAGSGSGIYFSFSSNNTLIITIVNSNCGYGGEGGDVPEDWYDGSGGMGYNGYGYGIHLYKSSNITLMNITANSNCGYGDEGGSGGKDDRDICGSGGNGYGYGIYLDGSNNSTLANIISKSNCGYGDLRGIYCYYGSNGDGYGYGIYLSSSNSNTVMENTASSNCGFGSSADIFHKRGYAGGEGRGYGIYLQNSNNNIITNNIANSNHGIGGRGEDGSFIGDGGDAEGYGIYLFDKCNNNTLTDNTANSNYGIGGDAGYKEGGYGGDGGDGHGSGIFLYKSSNNTFIDNTVSSNCGYGGNGSADGSNGNGYGYGIRLSYSDDNKISDNYVSLNEISAIFMYRSNYSEISSNCISVGRIDGIYMSESASNTLTGNNIWGCYYGIHLDYNLINNTIINNIIGGNIHGIYLNSSYLNRIYNNNLDNQYNAYDNCASSVVANLWDNGPTIGGNYWKDHQCVGNPSNGSYPYNVPGSIYAVDRYSFQDPIDADYGDYKINAPEMWKNGFNGSGVIIAILDTGIDVTHPDLVGTVIAEKDFTDDGTTDDLQGHGTLCAGIAAGRYNAVANVTGVAPGAVLLNTKVLNKRGAGMESWVIEGIQWTIEQNADILSMSLGDWQGDGTGRDPWSIAVTNAVNAGYIVVIAAGNWGPGESTIGSPAVAYGAIVTSLSNKNDNIICWSSKGPTGDGRVGIDVAAPGFNIVSANNNWETEGDYSFGSGTSMSCPHVAGAIALLLQANPGLTPEEIERALKNSADDIGYDLWEQGAGRLNIKSAYDSLTKGILVDSQWSVGRVHPGIYTKTFTVINNANTAKIVSITKSTGDTGDWITLSETGLTVPAGGSATFDATIAVPDSAVGAYKGSIVVGYGIEDILIPVSVNVMEYVDAATTRHIIGVVDEDAFVLEFPYGDWVYYTLDIQPGIDILNLSLSWTDVDNDLNLSLFNSSGFLVGESATLNMPEFISLNNPEAGKWTVAINAWKLTTAMETYNLTIKAMGEYTPPKIISFSPVDIMPTNVEGELRTFGITVDQTVDVRWEINRTFMQINKSVTEAQYTAKASLGMWNVTAIATNVTTGLSAMQTWIWKVSPLVRKYEIELTSGWNLISVPLNLTTWELGNESLVGDPLNVTPKNSLTSIYRYNTTSGLFEKCDHFDDWGWWPATGSESFTKLEPGRGYWVMAKNDCNLTFTGTAPSDLNVTVKKGWNLIGWYSMEEALLGEESVVGDPLNVTPRNSLTSIYRYNSSSGLFEKCDHFDDWGWWPATGSESFTKLEPGRGYWVMAKNDCVWRHEAIGG